MCFRHDKVDLESGPKSPWVCPTFGLKKSLELPLINNNSRIL